jgi:hypothetical protein
MTVTTDQLDLADALESDWLPWKRLAREQVALPIVDPGWWQALVRCRGFEPNDYRLVRTQRGGQWLGATMIRRLPQADNRRPGSTWRLDLGLAHGVGIAGGQPTALFHGLIKHWTTRPRRAEVLEWAFDQADVSWGQRWQTALDLCSVQAAAAVGQVDGWLLEPVLTQDHDPRLDVGTRVERVSDFGGGVGPEILYLDRTLTAAVDRGGTPLRDWLPILEYTAEQPGFRWYTCGEGCWVGLFACHTQRRVGGAWLDCHLGTWKPWCVVGRRTPDLGEGAFWPRFLAALPSGELPRLVLPTALLVPPVSGPSRGRASSWRQSTASTLAASGATPILGCRGRLGGVRWPGFPRFLARLGPRAD